MSDQYELDAVPVPAGALGHVMPSTLAPDPDELDRRTVRKLDLILLPFLALLFLFNSLDKSNIGNAETAHFTADVGLARDDLNVAVALFFAFFVTLQPVGAALGRKYGMARWVPACMSIWGLCTALHIFVRAAWQLYLLRIVIAMLEAGFYPVTVSYLSLFYTRFEFGRRLAIFYGQSAVAGALGGLLSYAVFSRFPIDEDVDARPVGGWHSWQILFLIEGGATITVALTGFFWLPHEAGTAWFLTPEERDWAEERIRRDREEETLSPSHRSKPQPVASDHDDPEPSSEPSYHAGEAQGLLSASSSPRPLRYEQARTSDRGLSAHDVMSALFSWKVYYLLVFNILSAIPSTAFSIFLPLVLAPLSSTPALANLLTAPPYICGAVTLYAFTSWSDRSRDRTMPILVSLGVVLVGFAGTIFFPSDTSDDGRGDGWLAARYVALCVLLSGTFIASPLTVAWLTNNFPAPSKRAIALGVNGWGNVAGVIASLLFSRKNAEHGYRPSFVWTACFVILAFIGFAGFRLMIMRENEWRRRVLAGWRDEDVEMERRWGRGPLEKRQREGVDLLVDLLKRAGLKKVVGWIEDWRGAEREGDDKITFVYGL